MAFFQILILAAITLALELFRPKVGAENARRPGRGDFQVPTAEHGRVIPIVWGTAMLRAPNVVWWELTRVVPIRQKQKTGLFSSKKVTVGYRYYVGLQMALCLGEIDGIGRVNVGGREAADNEFANTAIEIDDFKFFGGLTGGNGGLRGTLRIFDGAEDQAASSYLTPFQTIEDGTGVIGQPRYPGTAYVVWEGGYVGNSTSIALWEIEVRRIPNGLALDPGDALVVGGANPMNVIYEIITNDEWGLGLPDDDIDLTNFVTAAEQLSAEGNGFSFVLDSRTDLQEIISEIQRQVDGIVYIDPSSGKFKINLTREIDDESVLPLIDSSKILSVESFGRQTWQETVNQVLVPFSNADRDYQNDYAPAFDQANVDQQGGATVSSEIRFPGVTDAALANRLAWREVRSLSVPLAKARVVVDRSLWAIVPGDAVRLTLPAPSGVSGLVMRVVGVSGGTIQSGGITLDLIQDVFSFVDAVIDAPPDGSNEDRSFDANPVALVDQAVMEAPRAFVDRSEDTTFSRVWAGTLPGEDGSGNTDLAVAADIFQARSDSDTTPAESEFTDQGDIGDVLKTARLASTYTRGEVFFPVIGNNELTPSLDLIPDGLTPAEMVDLFSNANDDDIGENLVNLMFIGATPSDPSTGEFIACRSAIISPIDSDHVRIEGVWRGMLDSGHKATIAADTRVWLLFVAGSMTEQAIDAGDYAHIALLMDTPGDQLTLTEALTEARSIEMVERDQRPLPPVQPRSSGLAPQSMTVTARARDHLFGNEVSKLSSAYTVPTEYAAYSAEFRITSDFGVSAWYSTPSAMPAGFVLFIDPSDGSVPASVVLRLESRHSVPDGTDDLQSLNSSEFEVSTNTSPFPDDYTWEGDHPQNTALTFSGAVVGTNTFEIIADREIVGTLQYRFVDSVGGPGAWTTALAPGSEFGGTIGGDTFTSGDSYEFRYVPGSNDTDPYAFAIQNVGSPGGFDESYFTVRP